MYQVDEEREARTINTTADNNGTNTLFFQQTCTKRRSADTCKQLGQEVADQWNNDHVMLTIAFQKFEVIMFD